MNPSEVRSTILDEHVELRKLCRNLQEAADLVSKGALDRGPALHEAFDALVSKLRTHINLEDRILAPALREVDGWGDVRAEELLQHHEEQRGFIDVFANLPPDGLVRAVRSFIHALLEDMAHEEKSVLDADLLRDDLVGIDVEAG